MSRLLDHSLTQPLTRVTAQVIDCPAWIPVSLAVIVNPVANSGMIVIPVSLVIFGPNCAHH
jgi:hypothetical protein